MKPIVIAGVVLGVVVGGLLLMNGAARVYSVFPNLAILTQIGALVFGLRQTAEQGRKYAGQIGAGTLISLIGGLLIILFSLIQTAVFPEILDIKEQLQTTLLADRGMSPAEIELALEQTALSRTPAYLAISRGSAALITGVILSLIIAAFVRTKKD